MHVKTFICKGGDRLSPVSRGKEEGAESALGGVLSKAGKGNAGRL